MQKSNFEFYLIIWTLTGIVALIHANFGLNWFTGATVTLPPILIKYMEKKKLLEITLK